MAAIRGVNQGGFGKRHYRDGAIPPQALTGARTRKYVYDLFQFVEAMLSGGGAAAGTANNANVLFTANPWNVIHTYAVIGTMSDTFVPILVTDGLDIKAQAEASEGVEIGWGCNINTAYVRQRLAFQADVDRDFFYRVAFSVADVSGSDAFYVGWRKVLAYSATFTDYTDYCLLGWDGTDATQTIDIFLKGGTGDNTGNAYATSKTFADAATHTFEVRVNAGGGAQCRVDDDVVQASAGAFTFDSGHYLVPIFRYTNAAGGNTGALVIQSVEIGYLPKGGD